jgi:hypothetical protein
VAIVNPVNPFLAAVGPLLRQLLVLANAFFVVAELPGHHAAVSAGG